MERLEGRPAAVRVLFGVTIPLSISLYGGLFTRLRDAGLEVHVATGEPVPVGDRLSGVEYHVVPMRRAIAPLADAWALLRWIRLVREVRPDIAWMATPKASLLGLVAARACGVPRRVHHVWGCRWDGATGPFAAVVRLADRLACRCANENIAVSRSLAALLERHRMAKGRVELLGFGGTKGVDLERFRPDGDGPDLHDPPTVGFVGRLARDKGIAALPEILARVRTSIPDVRLLLVGGADPDDPVPPETQAALAADPAVERLGQVRDVAAAMRRMDVLCFPSRREGLPNAVIEAAACGVPAVGWRVTGTEDAIDDGRGGFLVAPFDLAAMADRIVAILSSPTTRREFARNARSFVAERWCSSRVEEAIAARILGNVTPERAGRRTS